MAPAAAFSANDPIETLWPRGPRHDFRANSGADWRILSKALTDGRPAAPPAAPAHRASDTELDRAHAMIKAKTILTVTAAASVGGLLLLPAASPAVAAPLSDYLGRWTPEKDTSRGLLRLRLRMRDGGLRIVARGGCGDRRCLWGRANARAYSIGPSGKVDRDTRMIVADLQSPEGIRRLLMIRLLKGNRLQVQALVRGRPGTTPYYNVFRMKRRLRQVDNRGEGLPPRNNRDGKPGTDTAAEACTVFEPDLVLALPIRGEWRLIHLGYTIKNFGDRRWQAERAARFIRQYRLRRRCHADRRNYAFEYWRHRSGIPKGALRGEDCIRIYPSDAKIRRVGDRWEITAWDQRYARANSRPEARYILRSMQQYNPSHLCQIGTGGRAMRYMRK